MSEQDDIEHEKSSIAERRFRRQQRRAARKRAQENADSRFLAAVFSVAAIGAALAIGLAVWAMGGGGMSEGLGRMSEPWIGGVTQLEVIAIGIVLILAVIYLIRTRKRR